MFQESVRDWQQMYDFLTWAYICSTYGEHSYSETQRRKRQRRRRRNQSPRWWPIMWCWELKWEQRSSSQPEKWTALQRDTVNLSTHFIPFFCLEEESGFRNNWKQSEEVGVRLMVLYEHKSGFFHFFHHLDKNSARCWKPKRPVWRVWVSQFWHFRIHWLHFHKNVLFSLLLFQLRLQRLKTVRNNSEAEQSEERLLTEARHGP